MNAKPLQILVVDDNVDSATATSLLLKSMGYPHSILAHDALDALQAAEECQPHVVFLDIGLPGMNGYEVCRQLRSNPLFAKTLIIAQTGWAEERNREMAYFAGFDHYFVKPLMPEDLGPLLTKIVP